MESKYAKSNPTIFSSDDITCQSVITHIPKHTIASYWTSGNWIQLGVAAAAEYLHYTSRSTYSVPPSSRCSIPATMNAYLSTHRI